MENPAGTSKVAGSAGAWLWLCCCQFFLAEQAARLAWNRAPAPAHSFAEPYSMARNYISDLGALHCSVASRMTQLPAVCSPLHGVMNGSFLLQGLLICLGAALVRGLLPNGRTASFALGLLFCAGLGVALVGLVPEDVDFRWHSLGAALNFVDGGLAMLLLGVAALRSRDLASRGRAQRLWPVASMLMGSFALLATALIAFGGRLADSSGTHAGTVERCAAYPLPAWLTASGLLWLLRFPRRLAEHHQPNPGAPLVESKRNGSK